ncbi:probable protein phosphatase 2C 72 [Carya illinoinensis]|uniref:probable protein phosphatase 2C 72 n=1 Tax=Carya illinoinensis TaxID=32201 RepID=UPI001C71A4D8|nr:probable protein phosphatase 2C 72 [Carya illinoinensis]
MLTWGSLNSRLRKLGFIDSWTVKVSGKQNKIISSVMEICLSVASLSIHDAEDGHENAIFIQGNNVSNGLGSLYSKQGSKGLNQDAANLYQGYGVDDGALCGVFDGHGKNGQVVSELVCNQLPSLLLSLKNALSKVNFYMWKGACISVFELMDKDIELQEILDCSFSGTTAVVAIRQGKETKHI